MQTQFGTYPHDHTETVTCYKCGACGVVNWDIIQTPDGPKKDFAGLSGGFYERLSKRPPYTIELVCTGCGTPAPRDPIMLLV